MDAQTYADLHRDAVGGGEIMTVAGLNPYQSPRELFEIKIGDRDPAELDNWHIDRGTFREPGNLAWASKRTGIEFSKVDEPYRSGPFIVTPDGVGRGPGEYPAELVIAEIKCPSDFAALDWGPDGSGSEGVPIKHLPQIHVEIGATGAAYGYAFGDIGGFIRKYRIPAHPGFYKDLEDLAVDFLKHCKARTPPPIDGSKASAEWLVRKYPKHASADLIRCEDGDVEAAIWKLRDTVAEIKGLEADAEGYRNVIKDALKDKPGYIGDFGKIYWKKNKESEIKPDAPRILAELKTTIELNASVDEPAASVFRALLAQVITLEGAYTTQKKSPRVFRPYFKKEGGK